MKESKIAPFTSYINNISLDINFKPKLHNFIETISFVPDAILDSFIMKIHDK